MTNVPHNEAPNDPATDERRRVAAQLKERGVVIEPCPHCGSDLCSSVLVGPALDLIEVLGARAYFDAGNGSCPVILAEEDREIAARQHPESEAT